MRAQQQSDWLLTCKLVCHDNLDCYSPVRHWLFPFWNMASSGLITRDEWLWRAQGGCQVVVSQVRVLERLCWEGLCTARTSRGGVSAVMAGGRGAEKAELIEEVAARAEALRCPAPGPWGVFGELLSPIGGTRDRDRLSPIPPLALIRRRSCMHHPRLH